MRCASFVVKKPMVIGHECAGVIEEVGSEVKTLTVGERVALEPGISCRRCHLCKEGRYNLCPEMKFFGSPPTNGSLANKVLTVIRRNEFFYFFIRISGNRVIMYEEAGGAPGRSVLQIAR